MSLDIYGLTRFRDRDTINRFLDEYVDRAASEDRGDEEIGLEPVNPELEGEAWQWEPALTLTHIIERGLAHPRRTFTSYLTSRRAGIERAILSFTRDDQLVLGFSMRRNSSEPEEVEDARARHLLTGLALAHRCHLGLVLVETPPPASEAEFRAAPDTLPTVYFADFEAGQGSD